MGRDDMSIPCHPLADRLPLMDGPEFDDLVENIRANGLLEPVTLLDGQILDGRNRARACDTAGVAIATVEWDGECDSPAAYVIAKNINRRHLTSSQRAAIGAELLDELEREAAARRAQAQGKPRGEKKAASSDPEIVPEQSGEAREKAASIAGTNPRYVSDAKKVRERDETLFQQVKAGSISLPEAARRATLSDKVARFPKDERGRAAAFLNDVINDGTHTQIAVELADNLLDMAQEERLRVFMLNESDNERDRALARTEAAKLPPMPHPALPHLRDAGREIARAARHLNGDRKWCDSIRQEINDKISTLKENAA